MAVPTITLDRQFPKYFINFDQLVNTRIARKYGGEHSIKVVPSMSLVGIEGRKFRFTNTKECSLNISYTPWERWTNKGTAN